MLVISNEVVQIIQGLTFEFHSLVGMLRPQELKYPEDALLIFAVIRPIHHSLVKSRLLDAENMVFFREEGEVYEVRKAVDFDVHEMLDCRFVADCLVRHGEIKLACGD